MNYDQNVGWMGYVHPIRKCRVRIFLSKTWNVGSFWKEKWPNALELQMDDQPNRSQGTNEAKILIGTVREVCCAGYGMGEN
jgi:hypothetical protein